MKSAKVFFIFMLLFTICLLAYDWIRNAETVATLDSPVIRIKTAFVIIVGSIIMKLTSSKKGFRLFLIGYYSLWFIYIALSKMVNLTHSKMIFTIFDFYKIHVPLLTTLPFIFFWIIDKMFLAEDKWIK